MGVVGNGSGAEVLFARFRLPRMDAETVLKDLRALKGLLES
ncbi:hypothetical protein [Amycolatopsis sp. GM8]|nr:hypothetical protein [Amycolatopsis sp. GM8]